jgi:hypothetical protein
MQIQEEIKRPGKLTRWKELKKQKNIYFNLLYVLWNNLDFFFLTQNAKDKVLLSNYGKIDGGWMAHLVLLKIS